MPQASATSAAVAVKITPVRSAAKLMPKGGSHRPIVIANGPSTATRQASAPQAIRLANRTKLATQACIDNCRRNMTSNAPASSGRATGVTTSQSATAVLSIIAPAISGSCAPSLAIRFLSIPPAGQFRSRAQRCASRQCRQSSGPGMRGRPAPAGRQRRRTR